jgi:AraC-like DNA-binding protein
MHETPHLLHKTPLRVNNAGAYEAPAGRHFPPHQHRSWELVYYRAGNIRCTIGGAAYDTQPGVLLLTPPNTVHAEEARTAYANFYLAIDAPASLPWPRRCLDDADRTLGRLCGALVREWGGQAPDYEEMLTALLEQLAILLRRARQPAVPDAERLVRQAEGLLAQRFATPLTIGAVAAEVGASPSYLRAQFARLRGRSPLAQLHELRLRHALGLLRTSTLTLDVIADLCGYHSASHLSRHVKRRFGVPPGALRDSGAPGAPNLGAERTTDHSPLAGRNTPRG